MNSFYIILIVQFIWKKYADCHLKATTFNAEWLIAVCQESEFAQLYLRKRKEMCNERGQYSQSTSGCTFGCIDSSRLFTFAPQLAIGSFHQPPEKHQLAVVCGLRVHRQVLAALSPSPNASQEAGE